MTPTEEVAPAFDFFDATDPDAKQALLEMQDRMYERPEVYKDALDIYNLYDKEGAVAVLEEIVAYSREKPIDSGAMIKAFDDWQTYFKQKRWMEHGFDPSTEAARKVDPEITKAEKGEETRRASAAFFVARILNYTGRTVLRPPA